MRGRWEGDWSGVTIFMHCVCCASIAAYGMPLLRQSCMGKRKNTITNQTQWQLAAANCSKLQLAATEFVTAHGCPLIVKWRRWSPFSPHLHPLFFLRREPILRGHGTKHMESERGAPLSLIYNLRFFLRGLHPPTFWILNRFVPF